MCRSSINTLFFTICKTFVLILIAQCAPMDKGIIADISLEDFLRLTEIKSAPSPITKNAEPYRNETISVKWVNGTQILARVGYYSYFLPNDDQLIVHYTADERGYLVKYQILTSLTRFPTINPKAVISLLGG